jgi:hypothetical protein
MLIIAYHLLVVNDSKCSLNFGRLYWTDSSKGTVESVNPDGSGRATFATSRFKANPWG